MAKLILSFQDRVLSEFPLEKERTTIGRAADNDIRIDNLAVSGHHAAVVTVLNDTVLEDLNSTNGTFVNGKPIVKQVLRGGDVITIGKHMLKYLSEARAIDQEQDKTVVIRPNAAAQAAAAVAPAPEAARPLLARLQVLNGPKVGRELELTKALTTLGKPGLQVAAISRREQGYYLVHVEGQEGRTPIVNGQAIGAQARKLNDGDTIEIANTKMGFFLI